MRTLLLLLFLFAAGCTNAEKVISARYPGCTISDVHEDYAGYYTAQVRCHDEPYPKTVRIKSQQ